MPPMNGLAKDETRGSSREEEVAGAPAPRESADGPPAPERRSPKRRAEVRAPSSPGVKAGAADDNLQFHAFSAFCRSHGHLGLPHVVDDRVVLSVEDRSGRPVSGARVFVNGVHRRTTYADGRALLHPRRWGLDGAQGEIRVEAGRAVRTSDLGLGRRIAVRLDEDRGRFDEVPLDVAFVLDTTGSMGDELAKLRQTLDVIIFQVSHMQPRPRLRLGMVLYRDRADEYVTQVVPFTEDLQAFERALLGAEAGGGGDAPEDLQAGLQAALRRLEWRSTGLRLAFLVGDAPPHLDYGQSYTYVDALEEAARRGIKVTTIGASGLDLKGELVFRQIAQATLAPFVFLTYGETGDSEGSPSTVSHHVGANWVAADLDAIIVRMVRTELSHFHDRGLEPREDWFSAAPDPDRSGDAVLEELFERSMKQLVDYAVSPLEPRTPTVVLPLTARTPTLGATKARLERRLALGLLRKGEFQLLETDAQADLLRALAEQLSLAYDEARVAEVGRLLPAELAVLGQIDGGKTGEVEVLVKLVRLETGEVLSLSLLKIDERLLL